MTYDLGKITAQEAHRQIVDHISRQLAACSAFNNNSLSYFGIEIKYKIELILHSRGLTSENLNAGFKVGELPGDPEVQRALTEQNTEAVTEHVNISDEQMAGTAARKVGSIGKLAGVTVGEGKTGEDSPDRSAKDHSHVVEHADRGRTKKA